MTKTSRRVKEFEPMIDEEKEKNQILSLEHQKMV